MLHGVILALLEHSFPNITTLVFRCQNRRISHFIDVSSFGFNPCITPIVVTPSFPNAPTAPTAPTTPSTSGQSERNQVPIDIPAPGAIMDVRIIR